jgi:hypothetical protein
MIAMSVDRDREAVHGRCANGVPCDEVTARLVAADTARRAGIADDNDDAIALILAQANRIAAAHHHGTPSAP